MMAKSGRAPGGYYNGNCEGSGSSGRIDLDVSGDSVGILGKCVSLSADALTFNVPVQTYPCSTMSLFDKNDLADRLRVELQEVRNFRKKVEFPKITNGSALSSSSDLLNGGFRPKNAMMKSKQGKKPDSSMKKRGNHGVTGRFYSAGEVPAMNNAGNVALMKKCEAILKKLMAHQYAWVFKSPVDVVKLNIPDYFTIIKHPMDLGTVKKNLSSGMYLSPLEFCNDVKLTFSNAMTYNPPGNDVHIMADMLNKLFEPQSEDIMKKLQPVTPNPVVNKLIMQENITMGRTPPPLKKRKVTPEQHPVISEPVVERIMLEEEKHKLGLELEALMEDMPSSISDFLRQQSTSGIEMGEDEIEIDIDDLSDDTMFELRKLLDDHYKQKNQFKAEPCEIELLDESGMSNSSIQPCKGDDLVDEDVDVGENEPPGSSYPPMEIEKDLEHRSSNCVTPNSIIYGENSSDNPSNGLKASETYEAVEKGAELDHKISDTDQTNENQSNSGMDHVAQIEEQKPCPVNLVCHQDGGEKAPIERQMSPDKLYRAALLKNRFAETIIKAREKTLKEDEKDPEKLRKEKEELQLQQKKEKSRLQAEAKAAEDAKKRVAEEAAAEAKRRRDLEREAARQALLEMEKTVEINENARILQDLEMLKVSQTKQLPSTMDETNPENVNNGLDGLTFGVNNPLEQLGLFMKQDDDDEEEEPAEISVVANEVGVVSGIE